MLFSSWLRSLTRTFRSRTAAVKPRPAANCRPRVEALEDRSVPSATQPNFVFILTDDQDVGTMQYMPRVQELLVNQGTTFENAFVTNPLCCPSNVSILTGQYSHNHQILHNVPPQGGFQKFVDMRTDGDPTTLGDETTLATWLQDAGYLTGRVGKYLVGYPTDSTYIPPGWDEWQASYGGFSTYFNYRLNENGTVVQYGAGEEDYLTDVMTRKSIEFIDRAEATDDQPFFLFYGVNAPHAGATPNGPPTPAPRHIGTFAGAQAPRTPSFNEVDVSDKPPHLRNLPPLSAGQISAIDSQYQARLESLQAIDEGIAQIIDALAARGELDNTYIFFSSDNGYHLGQHRQFQGKGEVYEEDIRVPLVVRGPSVRAGAAVDQMALNIDFAPTIAALAGAAAGRVMDGQSLIPLLEREAPGSWRQDFLVEIYRNPPMQPGAPGLALRTQFETYVEYNDGFRELYDLRTDPYQLQNIYATADPSHIAKLSQRLAELALSKGDPAKIESVVINDGLTQRSMVNSITVTFDRVVTLDPGAFALQDGDGTAVDVNVATFVVGGRTVAILTFIGNGIIGGSLADGDYALTVRGDLIRDEVGRELDGDRDGNGGGDRVEVVSRLFGDADGNGDVDHLDRDLFRSAFKKTAGETGYLWYFDFDFDGDVDGRDNGQFNRRFGRN